MWGALGLLGSRAATELAAFCRGRVMGMLLGNLLPYLPEWGPANKLKTPAYYVFLVPPIKSSFLSMLAPFCALVPYYSMCDPCAGAMDL